MQKLDQALEAGDEVRNMTAIQSPTHPVVRLADDGDTIILEASKRAFVWSIEDIPEIILALRQLQNVSENFLPLANGRVFRRGNKIGLSDIAPKVTFKNVGGRATYITDLSKGVIFLTPSNAEVMADQLEAAATGNG